MGTFIRLVLTRIPFLRFLVPGVFGFWRGFMMYRVFFLIFLALFTEAEVAQIWATEVTAGSLSFGDWWNIILNLVFFALDVYTIFWLTRFTIRYLHRRRQAKRLVHLKVLLPRNDSKLDNEKRNEKDFHEALGRGEQLYRALYETRDLNLYNVWVNRIFWGKPHISFELQYEKQEMCFIIVVDKYYQAIIEKQITSFYESAEIQPLKPEERFKIKEKGYFANGYYLHTGEDFWYPIQTYKEIEEDPLNNMANSFAKLEKEDKAVIQLVINPRSKSWQKKAAKAGTDLFKGKKSDGFKIPIIGPILGAIWWPFKVMFTGYDPAVDGGSNAPGASGGDHYVRMLASEEEIAKAIGEKAIQTGFDCSVRVLAASKNEVRVQEILNGMFTAFNVLKGDGKNYFENRRIIPIDKFNAPLIIHNFYYRLWNVFEHDSLLSAAELATIFHFPDAKYNKIPTIKWLDYKVLPPPINLPKEGVVIGNSVYRGETKKVRIMDNDRTRHMYIVGKSGSGKSVLLEYLAGQDVARGSGVCVIDPHGDLVEDVLSRTPKERAKEVMVFDPGDRERPMGLNILECKTEEEQDRASLDAMEIFIKLFGNEIFGPRIQHYFRNGCLTLMADEEEGATLLDVPRLFIDEDFQRYKVAKLKNPMVRAFWENEMANTGDREKQEMIPYFTSKFGPFVTNTTMRNIIGQTKSAFNVRECMDSEKVLLINLSKGKIGDINAQLLGLIMVSKINQAAMARADMPKDERKDFYLYVDEFQNFATDTFASILSEARKYRLNLIMAHQYIAQLSESAGGVAVGQKDSKIRDAVFGNVGTMMNFKVGAEDAEYFEKEYAPVLSQQDILSIANYKAYIKLNINNSTSRPFSLESIWDPEGRNYKIAEIIKKYSRMKYGRKKEFVDAEIEARMGISNINAIASTAKADPTVSDSLLGDSPTATAGLAKVSKSAIPAAAQKAPPVDPSQPLTKKVAAEKAAVKAMPKAKLPTVPDKVPDNPNTEPDIKVSVKALDSTKPTTEPTKGTAQVNKP